MFKPHYGICTQCERGDQLIVVKKGYCAQCNSDSKQARKGGKNGKINSGGNAGKHPGARFSGQKGAARILSDGMGVPNGQDIEGYTTVFRSPIRKKKLQRGGKRMGKDTIRKKVHFGKASGLQGIKKEHTRVYMQALGYTIADFIPCELTGDRCNDVHHIYARGMGGSDLEDELYNCIENLMGLTREMHNQYGDKKEHYDTLIEAHFQFLSENGVKYNKHFFEKWPKS